MRRGPMAAGASAAKETSKWSDAVSGIRFRTDNHLEKSVTARKTVHKWIARLSL